MEEPMERGPREGECRARLLGGLEEFRRLVEKLLVEVYEYNSTLRGTGLYLKPLHRVYKTEGGRRVVYEYYGRYWWRLEREGGRLRWRYLGRHKPLRAPDPPSHPLEGLSAKIIGDDVEVDCKWLETLRRLGLPATIKVERLQ